MRPKSPYISLAVAVITAFFRFTSSGLAQDVASEAPTPVLEALPPEQLFEPREFGGSSGGILKYRLLKPTDYDPNEKYPLVIFLHGAGERGDDNLAQLKHGMADFCKPKRRKEFPCYVLAPQCPTAKKWADIDWNRKDVNVPEQISESLGLVMELVDSMLKNSAIDKNRLYVTGLSMGGYGSWDALYRRPNFFAAAVPICGAVSPTVAKTISHVPVWCFHGEADPVVDVGYSRTIIKSLEEAGASPKYTEYPGLGHNSWTPTYANPEVYKWLFAQRRRSSPADSSQ